MTVVHKYNGGLPLKEVPDGEPKLDAEEKSIIPNNS